MLLIPITLSIKLSLIFEHGGICSFLPENIDQLSSVVAPTLTTTDYINSEPRYSPLWNAETQAHIINNLLFSSRFQMPSLLAHHTDDGTQFISLLASVTPVGSTWTRRNRRTAWSFTQSAGYHDCLEHEDDQLHILMKSIEYRGRNRLQDIYPDTRTNNVKYLVAIPTIPYCSSLHGRVVDMGGSVSFTTHCCRHECALSILPLVLENLRQRQRRSSH